ncbi:MAG: cytochrome c [Thermoleophilia bacterium]
MSRVALLLVALVAAVGLVAGCVESSEEAAQTPSDAPTVANSALQTDSEGNTVTAPPATVPADGGGTDTAGGGGDAGGDAAAGLEVFAVSCTGCHTDNGNQAGVGPQLAGAGLDEPTIRTTVENGRGAMPAGLVSGTDLDNVVAYVLSIQ